MYACICYILPIIDTIGIIFEKISEALAASSSARAESAVAELTYDSPARDSSL